MAYTCGKCKVEMEDKPDIEVSYNGMDLPPAGGMRCPGCGIHFLSEEMVLDEVNSAEQMLESK